ncbi:MAG: hypothetical protein MJ025_05080 [Victivallaceae bacterium]|nr:hypothetical protein [Victivallaceae bacterium]
MVDIPIRLSRRISVFRCIGILGYMLLMLLGPAICVIPETAVRRCLPRCYALLTGGRDLKGIPGLFKQAQIDAYWAAFTMGLSLVEENDMVDGVPASRRSWTVQADFFLRPDAGSTTGSTFHRFHAVRPPATSCSIFPRGVL